LSLEENEDAECVLEVPVRGGVRGAPSRYYQMRVLSQKPRIQFAERFIQIIVGIVSLFLRVGEGIREISHEWRWRYGACRDSGRPEEILDRRMNLRASQLIKRGPDASVGHGSAQNATPPAEVIAGPHDTGSDFLKEKVKQRVIRGGNAAADARAWQLSPLAGAACQQAARCLKQFIVVGRH
jgi:hypothetical protein